MSTSLPPATVSRSPGNGWPRPRSCPSTPASRTCSPPPPTILACPTCAPCPVPDTTPRRSPPSAPPRWCSSLARTAASATPRASTPTPPPAPTVPTCSPTPSCGWPTSRDRQQPDGPILGDQARYGGGGDREEEDDDGRPAEPERDGGGPDPGERGPIGGVASAGVEQIGDDQSGEHRDGQQARGLLDSGVVEH